VLAHGGLEGGMRRHLRDEYVGHGEQFVHQRSGILAARLLDAQQPPGQRVGDDVAITGVGPPGQEAHPGRQHQGDAARLAARAQPFERRPDEAGRQLLRAVDADLDGAVPDGGVAEPLLKFRGVVADIDARDGRHRRHQVFRPQPADECRQVGVGHALGHRIEPGHQADIGQRRMRAVQAAPLHDLERMHVVDQRGTDGLPGRPSAGEVVLDHPLAERLGHHRPGIHGAVGGGHLLAVLLAGRRRDAVHHGAREGDRLGDEAAEIGVAQASETGDDAPRRGAVLREIVADQHGEGRDGRLAPAADGLGEQPGNAARGRRSHQIGPDGRMGLVQLAGRGILAVALLADREGDDAGARIGHVAQRRLALVGHRQQAHQRAHDAWAVALRAAHQQRIQPVLFNQRVADSGGERVGSDDTPVEGSGREHVVGVDRKVRPAEGSRTQVHDAWRHHGAIVARPLDGRVKCAQGGLRKPHQRCRHAGVGGRHDMGSPGDVLARHASTPAAARQPAPGRGAPGVQ
jgi:hypothetical protein